MRTIAQKTAFHIALRDCSKQVRVGEVSIYVILMKAEDMKSRTYYFLQKFAASYQKQISP